MKRSLMYKSLTQFIVCVAVLLLLSAPLFWWLTRNFYAEDMIDIIDAVGHGQHVPAIDLEEDIVHGIMIQYALIVTVLGVAVVLMMRFISARLWRPFDSTLKAIESFSIEKGVCPDLPDSDVKEFSRLNAALSQMMTASVTSYKLQKEFTENASHELQTPLAVFQSKLDLLLQQPDVSRRQAEIIQELYRMTARLSRLNRNLLLLAKMENGQFNRTETVDVVDILKELLPELESIAGGLTLRQDLKVSTMQLKANRSLFESMAGNLVVNAVRHNKPGGEITVKLTEDSLTVVNTSDEPALDSRLIFNRFYRPTAKTAGNGLGLSIVKAVCDYHDWQVSYNYHDGLHEFTVRF